MSRHNLFRSADVNRLGVHFVPGVLMSDLSVLHLDSATHFHRMLKVRFFLVWG